MWCQIRCWTFKSFKWYFLHSKRFRLLSKMYKNFLSLKLNLVLWWVRSLPKSMEAYMGKRFFWPHLSAAKNKYCLSGCLMALKIMGRSYAGQKLPRASRPNGWGKMSHWPQFLVESQKVSWRWGKGLAQSPQGLYEWGKVACPIHPWPNGTASTGAGPTWQHSCLVWFRLL